MNNLPHERSRITAEEFMKKVLSLLLIPLIFFPAMSRDGREASLISGDYEYLSENVIRLHILADGDDDISQAIKLSVRDAVIDEFADEMKEFRSKEDASDGIYALTGRIKTFVDGFLTENSVDYSCRVELCESMFPDRTYESLYFPAGEYTALKISLGSGEGKNWWCVMYPPVCFAKMHEDENIPDDEVEVRWKIVEWWEEFVNIKK